LNGLKKYQAESEAKRAAISVLKSESADIRFRTMARVKAKLAAYERVYKNFEAFIEEQAENLSRGDFKDNPYKELGVARLVAQWLMDSEAFISDNEFLLQGMESDMRKRFVEEAFEDFPEDIRDRLINELTDKKHEILVWFAGRIKQAKAEVAARNKEKG